MIRQRRKVMSKKIIKLGGEMYEWKGATESNKSRGRAVYY